jgi:hypothetical protein
MTYGEFLRRCRLKTAENASKTINKTDFSRLLGLKDGDHYSGAENDAPGKKPGRELLEAAARLAGLEFEDCIVFPDERASRMSKQHEKLHRQLQEVLQLEQRIADALAINVETFHNNYVRKRR